MEQTFASRVLDTRVNQPRISEPDARLSETQVGAASSKSATSWGAIIAGAFVAAAASLILFALGSGLGFAEISPWPDRGVSATTFTVTTAIWLIVTQWVSAGLGGYIAGRLRTRWVGTHTHEVFFRDTAHGLVTWSVATVLVATTLASSLFAVVGGGMRAATDVASSGAQGAASAAASPNALSTPVAMLGGPGSVPGSVLTYGMDKLFRPVGSSASQAAGSFQGATAARTADPRIEAGHIIANALANGAEVPDPDRSYLADLVASRTGISQEEAKRRVDELIAAAAEAETKARAAADALRKAAAQASIYTALSLLVGAFIACVSAALGGRLRDEHP